MKMGAALVTETADARIAPIAEYFPPPGHVWRTGILETIREPTDLKWLSGDQLEGLAAEIRSFLIESVSRTGGHLGPNLGVVELTIALHRVFDSPTDSILFDTGHQAYVHKLLTGRAVGFGLFCCSRG